jgi:hypothetical protein
VARRCLDQANEIERLTVICRVLGRQDELAYRGAAPEYLVCLRGLCQREDFGHVHLDGA